jgi:hypothetical protein
VIVRINQFDAQQAEALAGWPQRGRYGPVEHRWPADTQAFEVLILENDENGQPVSESFRQVQLRQLIPEVLAALRHGGEEVILRLDGPLQPDELVPAFSYLTDARGYGRYSVAAVEKLSPEPGAPVGSVRVQALPQRVTAMCVDPNLGLERLVRLRGFCLPSHLADGLLEADDPQPERWSEIVDQCSFVLSTVREMQSLHVLTRRWSAEPLKSALMDRLTTGRVT